MRIHAEKKCAHRESSPAHEKWICALREEEDDEETFTLKSDESSRRLSRSHSELSFFHHRTMPMGQISAIHTRTAEARHTRKAVKLATLYEDDGDYARGRKKSKFMFE